MGRKPDSRSVLSDPSFCQSFNEGMGVWEREYAELHSIPGSLRASPAKILAELWRQASGLLHSPLVLDAGCGSGRNALYLAREGCRVEAVDFCSAALRIFRTRLSATPWQGLVKLRQISLAPPLPFDTGSFDVVLDIYVSCHFYKEGQLMSYWNELRRLLAPGGLALAAFFGTHDEYYSRLISDSPLDNRSIVRDPLNGITKRLYTAQDLEKLFGKLFTIQKSISLEFSDFVQNSCYQREILGFLLRNDL